MRRAALAALSGLALAALAVAACDTSEALSPSPTPPDGGPPPDASSGGAGGRGGGAPAPKRSMLQRNPFGNVAARDNLLWDGDFEWSSPFSDQYGWLWGPPFGFDLPPLVVGPACRSGLKCMTLPDSDALLAIGVGTTAPGVSASVWVWTSPESSGCAEVSAVLTWTTIGAQEDDVPLALADGSAGGWCHLAGAAPERAGKLYLYVENDSGEPALVDDAVVTRLAAPPQALASSASMDPGLRARARAAAAEARALRPADPPPDPRKEAFQRWIGAPGKR